MRRKITVSSFPLPIKENPYQALLYNSLKGYDVELYPDKIFYYTKLVKLRKKVDIIHFHWLLDQTHSIKRLLKFIARILEARILGYGIVWTAHNIKSHESRVIKDWTARFFLAHLSNAIITHGESIKNEIEKKFRVQDKVFVIPHGNYIDRYPNAVGRNESRKRLNMPDDTLIYLYFGLVRGYKGLENLVESFERVEGNTMLLIVGMPFDDKIRDKLETITKNNEKIRLYLKYIPDEDVQVFFNAADVVVLPFTEITSSGSLLLAMSFGKPVISVKKGVIPEIVSDDIGILIKDPSELPKALNEIRERNLEDMGRKAFEKAGEFDWTKVARAHRRVYEYVLNMKEKPSDL
jgi:beta-1,4-mannosyltransferase